MAILFCFSVFWAPSGRCFKVFDKVRKMGNEKIFYVFKNHQNRMKIERARRFFHFWPPGGHFLVCFNLNLDSGWSQLSFKKKNFRNRIINKVFRVFRISALWWRISKKNFLTKTIALEHSFPGKKNLRRNIENWAS